MQTRIAIAVVVASCWLAFPRAAEQAGRKTDAPVPLADHHQHLFSPELAALMSSTPPVAAVTPRTAADLIAQLDAAGIKRAVVLSNEVFVDAVVRNDPRTRHLYFDATTLGEPPAPASAQRWAAAIRRMPTRLLFGSDATTAVTTPGGAWAAMRNVLPLTDDEFKIIANNIPPYMR